MNGKLGPAELGSGPKGIQASRLQMSPSLSKAHVHGSRGYQVQKEPKKAKESLVLF